MGRRGENREQGTGSKDQELLPSVRVVGARQSACHYGTFRGRKAPRKPREKVHFPLPPLEGLNRPSSCSRIASDVPLVGR